MKYPITLKLVGTIRGDIWMPQVECTKEINVSIKRSEPQTAATFGPSFRDVLLKVTNDGDFQSCKLEDATIIATMHKPNRSVTRYWNVRGTSNEDCIA